MASQKTNASQEQMYYGLVDGCQNVNQSTGFIDPSLLFQALGASQEQMYYGPMDSSQNDQSTGSIGTGLPFQAPGANHTAIPWMMPAQDKVEIAGRASFYQQLENYATLDDPAIQNHLKNLSPAALQAEQQILNQELAHVRASGRLNEKTGVIDPGLLQIADPALRATMMGHLIQKYAEAQNKVMDARAAFVRHPNEVIRQNLLNYETAVAVYSSRLKQLDVGVRSTVPRYPEYEVALALYSSRFKPANVGVKSTVSAGPKNVPPPVRKLQAISPAGKHGGPQNANTLAGKSQAVIPRRNHSGSENVNPLVQKSQASTSGPQSSQTPDVTSFEFDDISEWADDTDKPPHSYGYMIARAITTSPGKKLPLADIYSWIAKHFKYYRDIELPSRWQNSIRHNLSMNKSFVSAERPSDVPGKGGYWTVVPGEEVKFMKVKKGSRKNSPKKEKEVDQQESATVTQGSAILTQRYTSPYTNSAHPMGDAPGTQAEHMNSNIIDLVQLQTHEEELARQTNSYSYPMDEAPEINYEPVDINGTDPINIEDDEEEAPEVKQKKTSDGYPLSVVCLLPESAPNPYLWCLNLDPNQTRKETFRNGRANRGFNCDHCQKEIDRLAALEPLGGEGSKDEESGAGKEVPGDEVAGEKEDILIPRPRVRLTNSGNSRRRLMDDSEAMSSSDGSGAATDELSDDEEEREYISTYSGFDAKLIAPEYEAQLKDPDLIVKWTNLHPSYHKHTMAFWLSALDDERNWFALLAAEEAAARREQPASATNSETNSSNSTPELTDDTDSEISDDSDSEISDSDSLEYDPESYINDTVPCWPTGGKHRPGRGKTMSLTMRSMVESREEEYRQIQERKLKNLKRGLQKQKLSEQKRLEEEEQRKVLLQTLDRQKIILNDWKKLQDQLHNIEAQSLRDTIIQIWVKDFKPRDWVPIMAQYPSEENNIASPDPNSLKQNNKDQRGSFLGDASEEEAPDEEDSSVSELSDGDSPILKGLDEGSEYSQVWEAGSDYHEDTDFDGGYEEKRKPTKMLESKKEKNSQIASELKKKAEQKGIVEQKKALEQKKTPEQKKMPGLKKAAKQKKPAQLKKPAEQKKKAERKNEVDQLLDLQNEFGLRRRKSHVQYQQPDSETENAELFDYSPPPPKFERRAPENASFKPVLKRSREDVSMPLKKVRTEARAPLTERRDTYENQYRTPKNRRTGMKNGENKNPVKADKGTPVVMLEKRRREELGSVHKACDALLAEPVKRRRCLVNSSGAPVIECLANK